MPRYTPQTNSFAATKKIAARRKGVGSRLHETPYMRDTSENDAKLWSSELLGVVGPCRCDLHVDFACLPSQITYVAGSGAIYIAIARLTQQGWGVPEKIVHSVIKPASASSRCSAPFFAMKSHRSNLRTKVIHGSSFVRKKSAKTVQKPFMRRAETITPLTPLHPRQSKDHRASASGKLSLAKCAVAELNSALGGCCARSSFRAVGPRKTCVELPNHKSTGRIELLCFDS